MGRGPTRRRRPDARLPASALPSPDVISIGAGRKIFFLKFFAFLGQEKSLSFLNIGTSSGTRSGAKKCIGKKIRCAGRFGDRRFSAGGGSGSPSSTHRAALVPLHALIGSASTTIRRGTTKASCTRAPIGADTSGGWRSRRPPRRRRQNSYRLNSSDAARSRRAHSGGPTRRSEIFSGRTVGFSSSTHRSHQKPLHVLIGSPLTIYEGGAVARTGSGGATMRTRNALLAYPHGRRRQQFSPASV